HADAGADPAARPRHIDQVRRDRAQRAAGNAGCHVGTVGAGTGVCTDVASRGRRRRSGGAAASGTVGTSRVREWAVVRTTTGTAAAAGTTARTTTAASTCRAAGVRGDAHRVIRCRG